MPLKTVARLSLAAGAILLGGCRASPQPDLQSERLLTGSSFGDFGSSGQQGYDDGAGYGFDPFTPSPYRPIRNWKSGEVLLQGYLAFNSVQSLSRTGGDFGELEQGRGEISQYPAIGGGVQWKLGGKAVDLGIEGLISIGGRANGGAFVIGGSGAAIAISLDLLIVDFYGGPFLSIPLGDSARIYGSVGPLIQFTSYDQSSLDAGFSGSGSGFGIGGYGRVGIEMEMSQSSYIGMAVRYSDTTVDLSNGLGDFELETVEVMLTFTMRG